MFIRTCKSKNKKTGKVYPSHQLVETVQTEKGPRTRILFSLGRLDLEPRRIKELEALFRERLEEPKKRPKEEPKKTLPGLRLASDPELVALVEAALRGDLTPGKTEKPENPRPTGRAALDPDSLQTEEIRSLGPEILAADAWEQLGVSSVLAREGFTPKEQALACALAVGRLVAPGSERATHRWLTETTALGELLGTPEHLEVGADALYRISDRLLGKKDAIEAALVKNTRTLFPADALVFLYDLSNVYLEGAAKGNALAKRGHSKEKRSDCPLISFSLVVDQRGFPIASRIGPGNQSEPETLPVALDRLETLSGLSVFPGAPKPTLVMDRGIATKENLSLLKKRGYHYCVVERRPVEKEYAELFEKARETFEWFAPHPERPEEGVWLHKVLVPETPTPEETPPAQAPEPVARVLVLSTARKAKEDAMDALRETRFATALEGLQRSIRKGACRRPDTVSRRIGKILARFPSVAKYYTVVPVPEKEEKKPAGRGRNTKAAPAPEPRIADLAWTRNGTREERNLLTGTYVIETSHTDRTSREIWSLYTTLTRVEDVFRNLKSDLGIRPVFHQKADRCRAHLFISILAYFLLSNIEHRLREKGETRSWKTLCSLFGTLSRTSVTGRDPHTGFDYRIRMTSKPEQEHRGILDKLGIRSFLRRIVSRVRPEKREAQEPSSGSSTQK
jgi:transposase